MLQETIEYKGYKIQVHQDTAPTNPFEEWDCLPNLIVINDNYLTKYGDCDIDLELTKEQIKADNKAVLALLNKCLRTFYSDLFTLLLTHREDYPHINSALDLINNAIKDGYAESELQHNYNGYCEKLEILSIICTIKGIKHLLTSSRGYSQGHYIELFLTESEEGQDLQSSADLYSAWAWGDVYGYVVEDSKDNDLDSCWGFYGSDFKDNNLLTHAKNAIDCHIKHIRKEKLNKIKQLITNRVPLNKRESIIN